MRINSVVILSRLYTSTYMRCIIASVLAYCVTRQICNAHYAMQRIKAPLLGATEKCDNGTKLQENVDQSVMESQNTHIR